MGKGFDATLHKYTLFVCWDLIAVYNLYSSLCDKLPAVFQILSGA